MPFTNNLSFVHRDQSLIFKDKNDINVDNILINNLFINRFNNNYFVFNNLKQNKKVVKLLFLIDFIKRMKIFASGSSYIQIDFSLELCKFVKYVLQDSKISQSLSDISPLFYYLVKYYEDIGLRLSLIPKKNILIVEKDVLEITQILLDQLYIRFYNIYKLYDVLTGNIRLTSKQMKTLLNKCIF